jgi:hypothetical protein
MTRTHINEETHRMRRLTRAPARRWLSRIGATAAAATLAVAALFIAPASPAMAAPCATSTTTYYGRHQAQFTNRPADGGPSWSWVYSCKICVTAEVYAKIQFYDGSWAEHWAPGPNKASAYTWWGRGHIYGAQLCTEDWLRPKPFCSGWVYPV